MDTSRKPCPLPQGEPVNSAPKQLIPTDTKLVKGPLHRCFRVLHSPERDLANLLGVLPLSLTAR